MTQLLEHFKYKCRYCDCELNNKDGWEHETKICPKKPLLCKDCQADIGTSANYHQHFCPMSGDRYHRRYQIYEGLQERFEHLKCKNDFCGHESCNVVEHKIFCIFVQDATREVLYKKTDELAKKYHKRGRHLSVASYEINVKFKDFECKIEFNNGIKLKELLYMVYLTMVHKYSAKKIGGPFSYLSFKYKNYTLLLDNNMLPFLEKEGISQFTAELFK